MYTIIRSILRIVLVVFLSSFPLKMFSQTGLPDISLTSTEGKTFNLKDFNDNNKATLVVFWATWCKPCIDELDNIAYYYKDWSEQADFNLVSICIDDSRTSSTVKSFVRGRDWPFVVLLDENQDLKRTLNVTDIPFYCIYDTKGR